jgi:hypothetical protein
MAKPATAILFIETFHSGSDRFRERKLNENASKTDQEVLEMNL